MNLLSRRSVVTLHEILRLGRFFAFAAGNSETRTDETGNFAGVKRRVGAAAWGGTPKGRGDQAFETRLATDLGARH